MIKSIDKCCTRRGGILTSILAVANHGDEDRRVTLVRKDGKTVRFYAPLIRGFQEESCFENEICLTKGKGLFLVVKK